MRVITTGFLATYPLGGLAWHYLHYLLGLRSLGHDVYYLEDTGNWMYDPASQTFTDQIDGNLAFVGRTLRQFELSDRWAVRGPDGQLHGISEQKWREVLASADVLLNVSGSCWLRDEYRGIPRKVFIDTDPGYNQIRAHRVLTGDADKDLKFSIDRMAEHDVHFTFGLNIGQADCLIPATQFNWIPTRQPIALDYWPVQPPSAGPFSTIMSWNAYAKPVEFEGIQYSGKESRLRRIITLPQHMPSARFELAINGNAPLSKLQGHGWACVNAATATPNAGDFHTYIDRSAAEFSVAKDMYVRLRTGWLGDRTPAYLAAGRPAIVEDTRLAPHLPIGKGLLTFTDLETAVECVKAVQADYAMHCGYARHLAEQYVAADQVLPTLLG